jgi:hypothetical protein
MRITPVNYNLFNNQEVSTTFRIPSSHLKRGKKKKQGGGETLGSQLSLQLGSSRSASSSQQHS